jgi:hypothetical protein
MARRLLDGGGMSARLVVALLLASGTALAQPGPDALPPEPNHAFAIEPALGGLGPAGGILMAALAASWRQPGSETWWRVGIAPGVPIVDVKGHILAVRAGIEHRREYCMRGCLYAGLDVELIDDVTYDDPEEYDLRAALLVARGGLDVGGDTVRFRLGLEIYAGAGIYHDQFSDPQTFMETTEGRFSGGMSITSALAFRF